MKTLYISDLDGTLLNANVEVSDRSKTIINELIKSGMNFSAATARTAVTACQILKELDINIPVILMNGVAAYDLNKNNYTNIEYIQKKGKDALLNIINDEIKAGFLYTIDDDKLSTFYMNDDSIAAKTFIEERERKYNKKFTKIPSFFSCKEKNIVYYSVNDKKENLLDAWKKLSLVPELHTEFYRDIYNKEHWYLEVCSCSASKKNALLKLKKDQGFDKVVCFGDNLNDIPMFEVGDEAYAVANAKDEVKSAATAVIGANTENGVAEFLKKNYTCETI